MVALVHIKTTKQVMEASRMERHISITMTVLLVQHGLRMHHSRSITSTQPTFTPPITMLHPLHIGLANDASAGRVVIYDKIGES